MTSENQKEKRIGPFDVSFLRRDGLYIVCLCIALGACIFVGMKLNDVVTDINNVWTDYVKENCHCSGQTPKEMMYNASQSYSTNTQEPSSQMYRDTETGIARLQS